MLSNMNNDCAESCGVYVELEKENEYKLMPDDCFRIGTLEFHV